MIEWVNQTELGSPEGKPARTPLSDEQTSWDVELPDYNPPLYEEVGRSIDLLMRKGIEVPSEADVLRLGGLTTTQAVELFGPAIKELRNPLGRTGIGLTGEFWQAGPALTADIAITRTDPVDGLQIALVENRGSLHLPGGFYREKSDHGSRAETAIREAEEETALDIYELGIQDQVVELTAEHVKPRSSRSADLGYISNQLFGIHLPDSAMGDYLRSGGDALASRWVREAELHRLISENAISPDHAYYAKLALEAAPTR